MIIGRKIADRETISMLKVAARKCRLLALLHTQDISRRVLSEILTNINAALLRISEGMNEDN